MSTYFVQGSTMDAIADAINAKTGGSSAMTPAQMVTAIGTISGGGGGMSWELVADYTSDADAAVVEATIPSGKQNSNIYRVHYKCDTPIWYGKAGINSNYNGYSGSTKWDCDAYVTKATVGETVIAGTSAAENYSMCSPVTGSPAAVGARGPLTSVGMQAYTANNIIPAGLNIKVWRLVES